MTWLIQSFREAAGRFLSVDSLGMQVWGASDMAYSVIQRGGKHTAWHLSIRVAWQHIIRVGQNRMYTPDKTVYLVISLPKIPY